MRGEKVEGTLAVVASLLVLFSAMIDPIVSVSLAVIVLASVGIWKLVRPGPG